MLVTLAALLVLLATVLDERGARPQSPALGVQHPNESELGRHDAGDTGGADAIPGIPLSVILLDVAGHHFGACRECTGNPEQGGHRCVLHP